jgi:hypothetical protein
MTLTVAFFTPSIHGHSNVHLTILRQLIAEAGTGDHPSLAIHVVGDEPVRKRICSLPSTPHASVTFYAIGDDDLLLRCSEFKDIYRARPASLFGRGGLDAIRSLGPIVAPPPELYLPRYAGILKVLQDVMPDLFVVDVLYQALGAEAARSAGVRYMLLSPSCSLDMALFEQPLGKGFWKYPMFVSSLRPRVSPPDVCRTGCSRPRHTRSRS